jgi:hypothetical protein
VCVCVTVCVRVCELERARLLNQSVKDSRGERRNKSSRLISSCSLYAQHKEAGRIVFHRTSADAQIELPFVLICNPTLEPSSDLRVMVSFFSGEGVVGKGGEESHSLL